MHISWHTYAMANRMGMNGTKKPSPYYAPSEA
jgi:hypothetical protein